jgi:hypothetical protein
LKQSFFLVIPKQKNDPQRLKEFDEKILEQWIAELPIANPLLASRLLYDYTMELNALKMPAQLRLDTLEKLRPGFLAIEEYLYARLLKTDFPKEENDKKTLRFLVIFEKELALSYWIALKEMTRQTVGWFQGKYTALAIHRCMSGLSGIIKSHLVMGAPVPDWIWIDLHALYKLGVNLKKHTTQVALDDNNQVNKSSSPEECYIETILLALANAKGLMQREIRLVYNFTQMLHGLVFLKNQPVSGQQAQCIILVDEDKPPFFQTQTDIASDSVKLYVDFTALYRVFDDKKIAYNAAESRFSALNMTGNASQKLTMELLDYLKKEWSGMPLESEPLFSDRLDRYVSIGLTSIFKLQTSTDAATDEDDLELLAQSVSSQLLSCVFKKTGVLSVGSLISFRKADAPTNKRALGIVDQLVVDKEPGKLSFGVQLLAAQAMAVGYLPLNAGGHEFFKKGLFYQLRDNEPRSYFIADTFMLKDGDSVRLFIDHEEFAITLKNKKNIGLGYWQFECLKVHEKKNVDTA